MQLDSASVKTPDSGVNSLSAKSHGSLDQATEGDSNHQDFTPVVDLSDCESNGKISVSGSCATNSSCTLSITDSEQTLTQSEQYEPGNMINVMPQVKCPDDDDDVDEVVPDGGSDGCMTPQKTVDQEENREELLEREPEGELLCNTESMF